MKLPYIQNRSKEAKKEKINVAIRGIEIHKRHIENLRRRLDARRRVIFSALMNAIETKDEMKVTVFSDEHNEIKRVLNAIKSSELSLIQIITRLESMNDISDAFYHMNSAFGIVKKVNRSVSDVVPAMEQITSGVNDTLSETLVQLGNISPNFSFDLEKESGKKIVESAKKFAAKNTNQMDEELSSLTRMPQNISVDHKTKIALLSGGGDFIHSDNEFKPTTLSTSRKKFVEDQVTGYVELNGGNFDVLDAAFSLGLPVEEVETAALSLTNQNRLSFRRREVT